MSNQQGPYRPYPGSQKDDANKVREELERRQLKEMKEREEWENSGCYKGCMVIIVLGFFVMLFVGLATAFGF